MRKLILVLIFIIAGISSCAKRGTISGGLKDTIPPMLQSASPKNFSTGFSGQTIRLSFDEYVKLKNINKQLIVSPPMKNAPDITPSVASRTITIKVNDTLQPDTTYSFDFGQSIEDNNESNPYKQFKYVFSTGSYIDSLSLRGSIKDAYDPKPDSFVSIMLYDVNAKEGDSVIYKQIPRYITNTLDSSNTFQIDNLKAGKYRLVGIKDLNSNFKFDPRAEKVAFRKEIITIPNDTLYELELFREELPLKLIKPVQSSGNRLIMGYEGDARNLITSVKKGGTAMPSIITNYAKKDSLQIWFKPFKIDKSQSDSLQISISKGSFSQNFNVRLKNQKKDSLTFTPNYTGVLPLREMFRITSSVPLSKFDESKIVLTDNDSTSVPFKLKYDERIQELAFDFERLPLQKYRIAVMPGAVTDYLEQVNDTLRYNLETKNTSEYGNLRLTLENANHYPIIVELTDSKGAVLYSAYADNDPKINFDLIKPSLYTLRVIYDENKNREWDTGSYLEKKQSEEVIYFPKEIDVRANWDVEQTFNLKR